MTTENISGVMELLESKDIIASEPTRIHPERYRAAEEDFVESIRDHPSVKSIYGTGKVSAPGISDLDFFVIVDRNIKQQDALAKKVDDFLSKYSYIMYHGPVLITSQLFSKLPIISDFTYLRHRYGSKFNLDAQLENTSSILRYFDIILRTAYKDRVRWLRPSHPRVIESNQFHRYMYFLMNGISYNLGNVLYPRSAIVLDVRKILCRLNGLKHDHNLFEQSLGCELDAGSDVLDKIEYYRQNYFKVNISPIDIINLILESVLFEHRLLTKFAEQQHIYEVSGNGTFALRDFYPTLATDRWRDIPISETINYSIRSGEICRLLPLSVLAHHFAHGNYSNISKVSRGADLSYEVYDDAKPVIEQRISLKAETQQFIQNNSIFSKTNIHPPHLARSLDADSSPLLKFAYLRNRVIIKKMAKTLDL